MADLRPKSETHLEVEVEAADHEGRSIAETLGSKEEMCCN